MGKRSRSKMEDAFRSMSIEHDDAPPLKRQMIPQVQSKPFENIKKDSMHDSDVDSDEISRSLGNSNGIDEEYKKVMYRLVFGEKRANLNRVDEKIEKLIRDARVKAMRDHINNHVAPNVSSTKDDFYLKQVS